MASLLCLLSMGFVQRFIIHWWEALGRPRAHAASQESQENQPRNPKKGSTLCNVLPPGSWRQKSLRSAAFPNPQGFKKHRKEEKEGKSQRISSISWRGILFGFLNNGDDNFRTQKRPFVVGFFPFSSLSPLPNPVFLLLLK